MLCGVLQMSRWHIVFRNKNGAALVTVLVAATAGIIALAGLTQLSLDSVKSARSAAREIEANIALAAIREALQDQNVCRDSLGGLNPNAPGDGNDITDIKRGASNLYSLGDTVVGPYNRILRMRQVAPTNSNPIAAPIGFTSAGEADFIVEFEGKGAFYGSRSVSRRVRLIIETIGGVIAGCSSRPYQTFFNNCVYKPPANGGGTLMYSPPCDPGYFVTGGGMVDGDISTNSFTNTLSGNRWACGSSDGDGRMRCYVICCR